MKLKYLLDILRAGELKNYSDSDHAQSDKIVSQHINLGLIELAKRFQFWYKQVIIDASDGEIFYKLPKDFLNLVSVFNSDGKPVGINEEGWINSVFLTSKNILQVPFATEFISVVYRASPQIREEHWTEDREELHLINANWLDEQRLATGDLTRTFDFPNMSVNIAAASSYWTTNLVVNGVSYMDIDIGASFTTDESRSRKMLISVYGDGVILPIEYESKGYIADYSAKRVDISSLFRNDSDEISVIRLESVDGEGFTSSDGSDRPTISCKFYNIENIIEVGELNCEVMIPDALIEPLGAYVAWRASMANMAVVPNDSKTMFQFFEQTCQRVKMDTSVTSEGLCSHRLFAVKRKGYDTPVNWEEY
ncbi:MAG: hypothetical protein LBU73_01770 [Helicobacteraceae bacterium]|jgi:hypothetical protein|nr:hypothetical protein [Helicobacteraceae bacterium]